VFSRQQQAEQTMASIIRPVIGAGLLLVLGACQSEEIRARCAITTDPASCGRAEYEQIRELDRRREVERLSGGGGGY
jgi:hypothetical protein